MLQPHKNSNRGVTFVEVLVSVAVVSLFFGGLTAMFQLMIVLISNSKAEAGAISVANEHIEYIRSLTYDSVGTIGGIPAGTIPQHATTVLNGISYQERVLVQNVDSPDDGEGAGDGNGILADYKTAKVEIKWQDREGWKSKSLITNIVPVGIETTAGGGTLRVNVFDAAVQPVDGASVHVYNDTTTSTIDTTVYTNVSGSALFSGAPAAANYEVTVTKSGYSVDQTYSATGTNANPNPPHAAVVESLVSTLNFFIDELSDLTVETQDVPVTGEFSDSFTDMSLVASSTNIVNTSGEVVLSGGVGSYNSPGTIMSTGTAPSTIVDWDIASFDALTPAGTSVTVHVYSSSTNGYELIPDFNLSGNAAGFTGGFIDISELDHIAYPDIALGARLETTDPNETPELRSWSIGHIESFNILPNIDYTLTSTKNIGSTASLTPVAKYSESYSTDAAGTDVVSGLEWDAYEITIDTPGYDIAKACEPLPFALLPDTSDTITLSLAPASARSLRVRVENATGDAILGAELDLTRTGYSDSGYTGTCGQYFFNDSLPNAADYQLDVSAEGYASQVITNITISGDEALTVILNP